MLNVQQRTLLLIAGCVWLFAGLNVLRLGIIAYQTLTTNYALYLGSFVIFCLFARMFLKISRKHTKRIRAYAQPQPFWRFFDMKSYLIMAVMMGGGIGLRASGLVPEFFIAFFYTGLGLALATAGVAFIKNYLTFSEQDDHTAIPAHVQTRIQTTVQPTVQTKEVDA